MPLLVYKSSILPMPCPRTRGLGEARRVQAGSKDLHTRSFTLTPQVSTHVGTFTVTYDTLTHTHCHTCRLTHTCPHSHPHVCVSVSTHAWWHTHVYACYLTVLAGTLHRHACTLTSSYVCPYVQTHTLALSHTHTNMQDEGEFPDPGTHIFKDGEVPAAIGDRAWAEPSGGGGVELGDLQRAFLISGSESCGPKSEVLLTPLQNQTCRYPALQNACVPSVNLGCGIMCACVCRAITGSRCHLGWGEHGGLYSQPPS